MSVVTVVPTVEESESPPRVRLDVTDTGTPALTSVTVTRSNPDGSTSTVRTSDGNPLTLVTSGSARVGTVYDYEAPYGAAVSYSTVQSPANVSAEVTVDVARAWLVHPGVPSISRPVTIAGMSARQTKVQRGVYYPMGRRYPVVQTDGQRKAPEYTLSLYTATDNERLALDALLYDASVLLFNVPADADWGVGAEYVSVGDVSEGRPLGRYLGHPDRVFDLAVTVVAAPVGGTQAARTLNDLLAFSTLDSLMGAYATFNDLLAGP